MGSARRQIVPTRGEQNCDWIESFCCVPEGALVGQAVRLRPWQREIICGIYDTPTRRAIISFGRKNGKTALSAFLLLLHLCGPEAKSNSQLYSAAQSREQAAILFSLAAKVVRMSPDLSQYVTIRDTAKELLCPELGSKYRALSAEASTAYGLSPVFTVHDELGQVKGPRSELYDALETAAAAQETPLSIVISTQAPTDADLLSLLIEDARTKADPEIKLWLYSADDSLDPFSDEAIRQANPAFGDFQNPKEVRNQAETARRMPSAENGYRNLILNQRVNMSNPFISRGVWEANSGTPDYGLFDEEEVHVALDLSAAHDLTSITATVRKDRKWHVWPTFFAPQEGIAERSHRDRVPYDVWAQQGFLITTPGKTVDYDYVAKWLAEFCADKNVKRVSFDRWRIDVFKAALARLGVDLPMEPFGQGFKDMTPALDALEGALVEEDILHGAHPVLTMCAANAVAVRDPAGNRKLDKAKATGRIDGMVTLAMCLGGASALITEPTKPLLMFMLGTQK